MRTHLGRTPLSELPPTPAEGIPADSWQGVPAHLPDLISLLPLLHYSTQNAVLRFLEVLRKGKHSFFFLSFVLFKGGGVQSTARRSQGTLSPGQTAGPEAGRQLCTGG